MCAAARASRVAPAAVAVAIMLLLLVVLGLFLPDCAAGPDALPLARKRNAMPEGFGAFLEWLQRGADDAGLASRFPPLSESFELRLGRFGQTLYATRRFERDETIALIPLSHLVSHFNYSTSTSSDTVDLAVYLAQQRRYGAASPWAAYDSTLPDVHDCRPTNWPAALLRKHMQGSHFPDAVNALAQSVRQQYDRKVATDTDLDISWEEFRWGSDTKATRALKADPVGGLTRERSSLMFPLFDLALHGDNRNIRCKMQELSADKAKGGGSSTVAALHVDASRRILPGESKLPRRPIVFPEFAPEPVLVNDGYVLGALQEMRS